MVLAKQLCEAKKNLKIVDRTREGQSLAYTLLIVYVLCVFNQILVQPLLVHDLLVLFIFLGQLRHLLFELDYFAHLGISLDSFLLYQFEALACHLVYLLQKFVVRVLYNVLFILILTLLVAAEQN